MSEPEDLRAQNNPQEKMNPQATPEQQQPGTQVTVTGGSPGTLSPHQQPVVDPDPAVIDADG